VNRWRLSSELHQPLRFFGLIYLGDNMQASSSVATRISALVVVLFSGLTPSVGWAKLKILAPEVSDPTGQSTPASVGEVDADSCHRVGGAHMCDLITPLGKITIAIPRSQLKALMKQK
jgi:hypothetical protein